MQDWTGFGALSEAFGHLEGGGYRKVFVIASTTGWRRFNEAGERPFFSTRNVTVFSRFGSNPDFRDILAGVEEFKAFQPDLVVALGGGSAIDVAKLIKAVAFTREPYNPDQPESLKPSGDGPPLVAVATTAGSGAEATQYAIFYRGDDKQSLAHPSLRPDMAIVDPEMSYSMPPAQTAATGFDALSQAVEAYWAASATPEARELARVAIGYILPNLYNAVQAPGLGNRYNMAMAAYLAGKAIAVTRTTMPHALGYHLTKKYGLPHGHAVAVTLPYFFVLNVDPKCPARTPPGEEANRENMGKLIKLFGQRNAEDCREFWRNFMRACGLAPTLREVGVDDEAKVRALVATMNPDRMKNHPVAIDTEYLVEAFLQP